MLPRAWSAGQRKMRQLPDLSDAPIRWLVDDCTKFVERELRRGNRYDAYHHGSAILRPWDRRARSGRLRNRSIRSSNYCTGLLSDEPLFFLVNSYTTGLAPAVLTYMIATELKRFGGHVESAGDRTAGNEERARAAVRGIRTVGSMIGGLTSLYMF